MLPHTPRSTLFPYTTLFRSVIQIDYTDQYLLISDDMKDQELKKNLRKSYRFLRAARPYIGKTQNRLWHSHDAMYFGDRSEEHTSELQSHVNLVCRLLLEKKK